MPAYRKRQKNAKLPTDGIYMKYDHATKKFKKFSTATYARTVLERAAKREAEERAAAAALNKGSAAGPNDQRSPKVNDESNRLQKFSDEDET